MTRVVPCPEGLDRRILMELQYRFPLDTPDPLGAVAGRLGVDRSLLVERLRRLRRSGVLKRIGFYINYRSQGLRAALIAYAAGGLIDRIAGEVYLRDPLATHVYERSHPVYNLWVVTKRGSLEELVRHAEEVSSRYGVDYVVLASRRTWKLSVKYDLERCVSRAGPLSLVAQNPPRPEELGVPAEALRLLRSLPIDGGSPYTRFAERLGISVEEAVRVVGRLLEAGVLGDPGAALDGHRAGIEYNAMVTMEPRGMEEELCSCAARYEHSTHVVQRISIPSGRWTQTCYAMLHARDESLGRRLVGGLVERCRPASYSVIRSTRDLKPGVVR